MQALDRITVYRLQVPLKVPYRLVFGSVEHFDTIIAEVIDRDGKTGFGEATILTGYTDETIEDSWQAAKAFAGNLAAAGDRAGRLTKELGVKFPFTATAFGTALEMLAGSHLLKLPVDTAVPLGGLLNGKDEESMHTDFEQLLKAGYRTIKVKVGFDLDKDIKLNGLPEYEKEKALIEREVRAIVDKVLEMGDGDAAIGTVRAFEAGVMDIPWSPNRHCKSRVLPARDVDGYLRILDPGLMPFPKEIIAAHEEGLRKRAEREKVAFGPDLAVQSVYEISEPLDKLLPAISR